MVRRARALPSTGLSYTKTNKQIRGWFVSSESAFPKQVPPRMYPHLTRIQAKFPRPPTCIGHTWVSDTAFSLSFSVSF